MDVVTATSAAQVGAVAESLEPTDELVVHDVGSDEQPAVGTQVRIDGPAAGWTSIGRVCQPPTPASQPAFPFDSSARMTPLAVVGAEPDPTRTTEGIVGPRTNLIGRPQRDGVRMLRARPDRRSGRGVPRVETMLTDLTALRERRGGRPIRLVVADMDGTLLDADGVVPERLWPLLDLMRERDIAFCPASGRQYATLLRLFESHADGMVFIAENGACVVRDGVEVSSDPLEAGAVRDLVAATRGLAAEGLDLGAVLCGTRTAWIERADEAFLEQLRPYYASVGTVPDLGAVTEHVVKVAVHALDRSEEVAAGLASFAAAFQVVVSSPSWVDVMNRGTNKGTALRRLQESLGVTADETIVFGDYLNDLEMLDEAALSFAMDNAHATVLERARHRAPSNRDHGVVHVLESLLGDR